MPRILEAALIVLMVPSSAAQAGWRHHHHQPVYYYAAPAYMPVQGGQSSAQNGPLQDALLQIVAGVIRDRLGQIGGGNGGTGGTTTTPSSQTEIGQLRAEMREMHSDLSLRIENANSILQSQGKKLIENEAAIKALQGKFEGEGEIRRLLTDMRAEIDRIPKGNRPDSPPAPPPAPANPTGPPGASGATGPVRP